jgi:hypothetical protein
MKKLTFCSVVTILLLSFIPAQLKANEDKVPVPGAVTKTDKSSDTQADLARLNEINAMDMSTLNRSEKKELRVELRSIKNGQDGRRGRNRDRIGGRDYNGHRHGGAIYFAGGGGLLIILLIIILI